MRYATILLLTCCSWAAAQDPDPAYTALESAYALLAEREYDAAIAHFRVAADRTPSRADIRKDLAYALVKIGENDEARDEFAAAMELAPEDHHLALEYAFLCHETGEKATARRVFDRVRTEGDPESRRTAEQALENIDAPLREGIARWREVIEGSPDNFSARYELAQLAEQRDEVGLAAKQYEECWRLRPDRLSLLMDLGRVLGELGDVERSTAALLAASRGAEPRTAEQAHELLPERYPYVYEFEQALELTPGNVELRREFAYLLLAMDQKAAAEEQFCRVMESAPDDLLTVAQLGFLRLAREDFNGAMPLLRRVLASGDEDLAERVREAIESPRAEQTQPQEAPQAQVAADPKDLARRSLQKSYLNDALRYLRLAHDSDPTDFAVMLDLGRAHNALKQDEEALRWFNLARRSPDPGIALAAAQSYDNLRPDFSRFRTTFWMMPLYSTRWRDLFGYAQLSTEVRLRDTPIRPYLSVRFAGDARRTIGSVNPQYLSESSFVFGVGVRTRAWNGLTAWAEAGSDVSYLDRRDRPGRMAPDYRGGVSFGRGWGNMLGGEAAGGFFDTSGDAVFMSRFANTVLLGTRNRAGYTAPVAEALGSLETQLYWNVNATVDTKRQNWANFLDTGPGVRFRWKAMPPPLVLSVDLFWGRYLMTGYPDGPVYRDLRAGIWYAFSR